MSWNACRWSQYELPVTDQLELWGSRHRKNFWPFTGPKRDFGLILLILNMIIHKSFTGPAHSLLANVRGPVSFAVSGDPLCYYFYKTFTLSASIMSMSCLAPDVAGDWGASWGPFYKHGLTLIPAWISNHMSSKVWDEITYPFPNFNGCPVEV